MTTRPEDSMPYWIGWFGQTIVTAIAKGEPITVEQARTVHTGLCAAAGLPDDYLDKFTAAAACAATLDDVTPEPERTAITAEMLAEHAKWRKSEGGKRIMLAGAYLAGANLAGANLAGANLAGAYLAGAHRAGAHLADANLAGAKGNRWTTLPTGWKVDDSGLIVKVRA